MKDNEYSLKEIKITAMTNAPNKDLVEYVRKTGKLPKSIIGGGFHIAARVLIDQQGTDPTTLTEDE